MRSCLFPSILRDCRDRGKRRKMGQKRKLMIFPELGVTVIFSMDCRQSPDAHIGFVSSFFRAPNFVISPVMLCIFCAVLKAKESILLGADFKSARRSTPWAADLWSAPALKWVTVSDKAAGPENGFVLSFFNFISSPSCLICIFISPINGLGLQTPLMLVKKCNVGSRIGRHS